MKGLSVKTLLVALVTTIVTMAIVQRVEPIRKLVYGN